MYAILILGLLFLGVGVAAVVKGATLRRVRTIERLGTIEDYGFAGQAPAPVSATQPTNSGIADLVERVGGFIARNFGGVGEEELRRELMAAGMYSVSPRMLLGYRVLAAVLLPILVLLAGGLTVLSVLFALAMVAAGWMLPIVLVRRKARVRLREIDRRLPDLIDLLVVTIEAGLGFGSALRMATDNLVGPLSDELRLTLQEQTMGLAIDDALSNLMARADTPAMRSFVRSMAQGEKLGISMGQIMRNLALDMRKRRRKAAEEQAQKAPIKMLFPLVFLIFPSLFIVLMVPALLQLISSLGSG